MVTISLRGSAGNNYVDDIIIIIMIIIIIHYIKKYDRMCAQLHFALCYEIGVKLEGWSLSESVVAIFSKERPDRITRSEDGLYPDRGSHLVCTVTATPCRSPSFTDTFRSKTFYRTWFIDLPLSSSSENLFAAV